MNSKEKENVTLKDIGIAIRQLPDTIHILCSVDRRLFGILVVFSMLSGVLPVVSIMISQNLINTIVDIEERTIERTMLYLVAFIAYNMVAYGIGELSSYITTIYQYKLQYGLQLRMMRECSYMDLHKFESSSTYDRVEKLTTEIAFRPFQMFMAVISLLTSVVSLISVWIVLFIWNPKVAFGLLVIPLLAVYYYLRIGQKEFDMMWNRADSERKLWYYNFLMTHDGSFKEMKVLNLSDYLLTRYKDVSNGFIIQNKTILNRKTRFNIIYGCLIYALSGFAIAIAVMDAYLGRIMVGNVMSIIRCVSMVQSTSKEIMTSLYRMYSCSLYMNMFQQFLAENQQREQKKKPIHQAIEGITMDHVSYSYDGKTPVLQDISIHITRGKRIAIVGPNGSGKSTLLKLMVGLYKPQKGSIRINDIDSNDIETTSFYERISVLFQDFVKYELSLRENIGFGDIRYLERENRILQSLESVGADFLRDANGEVNLHMQLGNWFAGGRELSQGQWQKVALSRIYMKDADCYMLDEPNAALDTLSEKDAFSRFFRLSQNKIGIYISHRLCAAKMADEIIVMQHGRIVDVGSHDQLMARCRVYQDMYEAENYQEAV